MYRQAHQGLQKGFTLIELLIAMVVGLFLTSGLVALVVGSQQSFRLDESVARMQDESRFAIQELSRDLRMTGYAAGGQSISVITIAANFTTATDCGIPAQPDWILRFNDAVSGDSNMLSGVDNATGAISANYSCIAGGEIQPNTDVVAVKRFAGNSIDNASVVANRTYLRSTGGQSIVYRAPLVEAFPAVANDNWEYRPGVYYIRNFSDTAGDGIPSLCRKQLTFTAGGTGIETECLARGVEDLQVEYGIDPDDSGSADRYESAPTPAEMMQVVSVRIFMLARSLEPNFSKDDPKTYQLSNGLVRTPTDEFNRRVYTITVPTANLRSQNFMRTIL